MHPHAAASEGVRLPTHTLHPEDDFADALVRVQLVELSNAASPPSADRRDPRSWIQLRIRGAHLFVTLTFVIKEGIVIAERGARRFWRRCSLLLDEGVPRRQEASRRSCRPVWSERSIVVALRRCPWPALGGNVVVETEQI